jgi:hypothetical protein
MPPIDGIGKPSAMLPVGGADGTRPTSAPAFEAPRMDAPAGVDDVAPPSALERLTKGDIGLPEYLDAHVEEATSHLEALGREEITHVRAHLRSAIASDPVLVAIVRQATGQTPESE